MAVAGAGAAAGAAGTISSFGSLILIDCLEQRGRLLLFV
jgi:hypothetical protein